MMAEMVFLLITVETQSLVRSGHSIIKCDYKSIPAQWNFCYDMCTEESEKYSKI